MKDTMKQLKKLEKMIKSKKDSRAIVFCAPQGAGKSQVIAAISDKHKVDVVEHYCYGASLNSVIKAAIDAVNYDERIVVSINSKDVFNEIESMGVINCVSIDRDFNAVDLFIKECMVQK